VNTHEIAQHVDPGARVAYVDNDPMVISHAGSLLAKSPGVIAVPGDMRHPGRILADAELTELIDLAKPACVILSAVLHFLDAGAARDVARAFARALVPGSYVIISVGSGSPSEGENFTSAYTAARIYIHSLEEVRSFFDGVDLVSPGVVPVTSWYGDEPAPDIEPRSAVFLGAVARKPLRAARTRSRTPGGVASIFPLLPSAPPVAPAAPARTNERHFVLRRTGTKGQPLVRVRGQRASTGIGGADGAGASAARGAQDAGAPGAARGRGAKRGRWRGAAPPRSSA
jgi:S-adenosyl methyltransferase